MTLTREQEELCSTSQWDFSDLRAVFLNCTLKKSPEVSHTEGLMKMSQALLERNGVAVDFFRVVDHNVAFGVYPDMREYGWDEDDWPRIYDKLQAADILVLGSPIWLGEKSSVCTQVIERLYAHSGQLNDRGQYSFYGKVGGCLITGNEDGVKHCAMGILYADVERRERDPCPRQPTLRLGGRLPLRRPQPRAPLSQGRGGKVLFAEE